MRKRTVHVLPQAFEGITPREAEMTTFALEMLFTSPFAYAYGNYKIGRFQPAVSRLWAALTGLDPEVGAGGDRRLAAFEDGVRELGPYLTFMRSSPEGQARLDALIPREIRHWRDALSRIADPRQRDQMAG